MALEIGGGITFGGGISITGAPLSYTAGTSPVISITTFTGAAPRIEIVTSSQVAELLNLTGTATLSKVGTTDTFTFDGETETLPVDNGNGTWTYAYYSDLATYPGDSSWDSIQF